MRRRRKPFAASLPKNLKQLRYRRGNIDGYASRLHYFTDWLADNQKKNKLKDVSRDLGGRPHRKKINFMTAHRDLYAGLKNEIQLNQMMRVEKNLSRRVFYIIDKNRVSRRQAAIQQGDLIAFATNQEGLDVAHVGFAVRLGGHRAFASRLQRRGRRGRFAGNTAGLPEAP